MLKKGDWLIKKWNEENGGEIDFARVKEILPGNKFTADIFFRHGEIIEDLRSELNKRDVDKPLPIEDDNRNEFNWRKATEQELAEYLILEPKPFNI